MKCQWVYRTKFTYNNDVECHKARLVGKGFSEQEGIAYTDTFYPVANMNFVRLILSLVAHFGWKINQIDFKSTFYMVN